MGKVLFESAGHLSWPRFSPDGKTIAFLDHPFKIDDRGAVAVIDLSGRRTKLSRDYESVQGLAWSPDGREVWFSGAESGTGRALRAVTLSGKERVVSKVPGSLTLRDISKTGLVLVCHENIRKGIMGLGPGQTKERELSWLEWSLPYDLSRDGTTLLFNEQGQATGDNYAVCIRKTDGSPVIRLGDGIPRKLSPDGKWVIANLPKPGAPLTLLPTGTGQPRDLATGSLSQFGSVAWLPDSHRFVFGADEQGGQRRVFLQSIDGGAPRAVSPPGIAIGTFGLSSDGTLLYIPGADGKPLAYPIGGGPPVNAFPKLDFASLANLQPISRSSDGRFIFVRDLGKIPVSIYRVEIATGKKEVMRELSPGDPAGLQGIGQIHLSADGRYYVYGYTRALSDLYAVDGLK
jgi:Tol biopolymer transport system component